MAATNPPPARPDAQPPHMDTLQGMLNLIVRRLPLFPSPP